ncbi:unnamed protein product [Agarophyton chilense]
MTKGAISRLLPFSGIGIGFGFGIGCGGVVGCGIGGKEIKAAKIPGFGWGVGCGVGFGFGWGFFLLGIGTPVCRATKLLGFEERMMKKKAEEIDRDLAAGKRPHGALPDDISTSNEAVNRFIRALIINRAKMRSNPGKFVQ